MLLARLIAALLLLVQPLPALGLESVLPCAQGCAHCGAADLETEPSGCGCESGADAQPQQNCSCAHEAPLSQPCSPATSAGLSGGGAADCEAPASALAPRGIHGMPAPAGGCAPGLGHDPPPRLAVLCVWRN